MADASGDKFVLVPEKESIFIRFFAILSFLFHYCPVKIAGLD